MAKIARPPAFAALAIALAVMGLSCGTCPFPFITSISPTSATAGGSQFLLTINGDDFRHDSVVNWNGSFVVTTFVSIHQLLALIPAADIVRPETVAVFVFNPPEGGTFISGGIGIFTTQCGGRRSNAAFFTVSLDAYASSYCDPFAAVTFPGGDRVAEIRKLGRTARLGLLESSVLQEPSRIRV